MVMLLLKQYCTPAELTSLKSTIVAGAAASAVNLRNKVIENAPLQKICISSSSQGLSGC